MNLEEFPEKDGMKVWLDEHEASLFVEQADGPEQRIAFLLGVRCGLRASEILDVAPKDVRKTTAGPRVRVWEGKGDKYREPPAPLELVRAVEYYSHEQEDVEPLLDRIDSTRTIARWVKSAGAELHEATGDEGWTYLTPHDLRRTWATLMRASEVDPMLVCDWGGWSDLETFLEHYRGRYSPEVQRREVEKVDWLDVDDRGAEDEQPRTQLLE